MKVPKTYLGKRVTVHWEDPSLIRTLRMETPLRGRAALALQIEEGVIDDITDGVVRVCHTTTRLPGDTELQGSNYSYVVEDLIIKIVVYEEARLFGGKEEGAV